MAAELKVPAAGQWPFVTQAHFRFVSNTSVSFVHYLSSVSPEEGAALKAAIVRAADSIAPRVMSARGQVNYFPTIVAALAYQHTGDKRYAEMVAALLQRLPMPRGLKVPAGYLETLRGLDFEAMVETARRWGVNDLYTASIHDLVPLPHAIAALQKAGMDEAAVWAVARANQAPDPFEEVIPATAMGKEFGFLFQGHFVNGCPSDQGGGRSELVLLEDGKPLGPAHCAHAEIRKDGKGRWSHWGSNTVWFSTSDNSDPRTNGRQYKVEHCPAGK